MSTITRRRRSRRKGRARNRPMIIARLGTAADASFEEKSVRMRFRHLSSVAFVDETMSFTSVDIACTTLGDRLSAVSDQWLLYRVKSLRVTTLTNFGDESAQVGYYAVSAVGAWSTTAVSSFEEMVDHPCFNIAPMAQPSKVSMVVPPNVFSRGQTKWYYTRDQGEDLEYIQGRLWFARNLATIATVNPSLVLVVELDVEFSQPIDPDINPVAGKLPLGLRGHTFRPKKPSWADIDEKEQAEEPVLLPKVLDKRPSVISLYCNKPKS